MLESLERRTPILMVVLGVITFLVFIRVLGADFVNWDDPQLIYNNALVRLFSPAIFWSFDPEIYIPLTLLSYQIEHALFGFEPFVFHLTSLLLHVGNTLLVFWLFRQLLQLTTVGQKCFCPTVFLAFLGAFLFAVHPLSTETVAWLSARKDVLSTFFFLLSLTFSVRCGGETSKWLLWSVFFFLCALASKVTVVTLPVVLLLIDYARGREWSLKMLTEKWLYFALAILFGVIALFGKARHIFDLSFLEHILLSIKSFGFALIKLIIPTQLSVLYPQTKQISLISTDMPIYLLITVVFFGVCFLVRRKRALLSALLILFVTFLPSILTFVKSGGIYFFSDRYAYIPSIGAILVLLLLIKHLGKNEKFGIGALTIVILVVIPLTWVRTGVWKNTETLFSDVLLKNPQAQAAHTNLGEHYLRTGDISQAEKYLESSLAISPAFAIVHNNLGLMYMQQGRMTEALEKIETAIAIDGSYPDAYVNLGVWYGKSGNFDRAEEALFKAVNLKPDHTQALFNLGGVYQSRGEIEQAIEMYKKVLKIDKRHRDATIQLSKLQ